MRCFRQGKKYNKSSLSVDCPSLLFYNRHFEAASTHRALPVCGAAMGGGGIICKPHVKGDCSPKWMYFLAHLGCLVSVPATWAPCLYPLVISGQGPSTELSARFSIYMNNHDKTENNFLLQSRHQPTQPNSQENVGFIISNTVIFKRKF